MARSISKLFAHFSVAVMAPVAIACLAPACSSDEPVAASPDTDGGGATGNTGGGANTGGRNNTGGSKTGGAPGSGATAGAGGSTGGSPGTGGSKGGTAGAGGSAGGAGGSTGGTPATGGAPAGGAGGTDGGDGGDGSNCAPLSLTPPTVTTPIQVPAGATVVKHFHAVGTQNYTCTGTVQPADAGTTYSWGASVPEADLFQGTCKVGTHYTGPWWKFTADGSAVKGAKVNAEAHTGTIPWLLLNAVDHTGTGILSNVTFVQRVDTTGGATPSDQCDATHNLNEVKKIPYTADYYFFEGGVGDAGP